MEDHTLLLPGAIFSLFSIAMIWPPDEFVSAGATFEHLFWRWIGDFSRNVVEYQLRKAGCYHNYQLQTGSFVDYNYHLLDKHVLLVVSVPKILINRVCVLCLPGLFAFYIVLNVPPTAVSTYVATACLASMITGIAYAFFTISTNFSQMRQMKELALYGRDTKRLMTEITTEYLEFANFAVSFAHSSKLVVGSHWLIHITRFDFTIVNLSDVNFEVVRTTTVPQLNIERSNDELQFLVIEAQIRHKDIKSFRFRVRTDQFRDLEEKVAAPIGMARNVILHQSLNERFVKAFVDCIDKNPRTVYSRMGDLEACFGCALEIPNVKLEKRCTEVIEGSPACRQCFCRPMWCVGCLGRIFAAKQDQQRPDRWLDGQASCPTCRSEFCMLDVSFIVAEESQLIITPEPIASLEPEPSPEPSDPPVPTNSSEEADEEDQNTWEPIDFPEPTNSSDPSEPTASEEQTDSEEPINSNEPNSSPEHTDSDYPTDSDEPTETTTNETTSQV